MKNHFPLINFLINIFFIFLPALIGYVFYLPEWNSTSMAPWIYWIAGLGFLLYSLIISYIFIFFRVTNLKLINVAFPLAWILVLIFVSSSWHIALRMTFVFISVGGVYPLNKLVDYISQRTNL